MTTLKTSFESGLQELRTMRDEIRVRLHLAGKEAREQWEKHLEPHVGRIEKQLKETREDALDSVKDALERARTAFQEFRARLTGQDEGRQALDETVRADRSQFASDPK